MYWDVSYLLFREYRDLISQVLVIYLGANDLEFKEKAMPFRPKKIFGSFIMMGAVLPLFGCNYSTAFIEKYL